MPPVDHHSLHKDPPRFPSTTFKQIKHVFILLHYSKHCSHAPRLRTEEVFWKRSLKRTHTICYSTYFFRRCGCG